MRLSFRDRVGLFIRATVGLFSGLSLEQTYGMFAGIFPGAAGLPPRRGTKELLQAYNEMPWLRAVVNKVGRSVASTSWRLYVVRRQGKAVRVSGVQRSDWRTRQKLLTMYRKQAEVVEIEDHPLLDLLERTNTFLTGLGVRQLTQIYLDLVGEAFWLKERNGAGRPVAVWPLPPDWVISTPTPVEPFYRVSFRAWQGRIPDTEILWFVEPDPANPYGRGSGMARALGDELETDEYAAKHTKAWFYNRARPDVIITADGLKMEETRRLEEDWLAKSQGFWRAYKPYFLNRKIDVHTLSQTFENMQLVELRKYERDTIIQVYGLPPEILGIIESSNRATIEAADYLFARWVVQPRLEFLRNVLQERLVPEFDDRLILDYESPVAEDKEYRFHVARAAPWALRINEWREMMDLEPLPEGQAYMLPFNMYVSGSLGGAPPTGEGRKEKRPAKELDPDLLKKILAAVAAEYLLQQMQPVYQALVAAYGRGMLDTLAVDLTFDLYDARVTHFLETEATQYVKGINETTRRALQEQLVEGMEAGESIPELARRISAVFEEAKGLRSTVIARTECVRASNFAGYAAMKQAGIEYKEWLATRDERVRDAHLAMDGQMQPIDKPFVAPGGQQAMYPGGFGVARLDINCRCTVLPVVGERTMLDTEEKRVEYWRKYDSGLRTWERKMQAAVKKAFQAQQDAVMAILKERGRG